MREPLAAAPCPARLGLPARRHGQRPPRPQESSSARPAAPGRFPRLSLPGRPAAARPAQAPPPALRLPRGRRGSAVPCGAPSTSAPGFAPRFPRGRLGPGSQRLGRSPSPPSVRSHRRRCPRAGASRRLFPGRAGPAGEGLRAPGPPCSGPGRASRWAHGAPGQGPGRQRP